MPKLDLTRAIRIKGAGGEINALKGQGFSWTKPIIDSDPILAYFQSTNADGAYYTPWDKSTLFQDAAGTIPVVNDGDPVGLMLDVSGTGVPFNLFTNVSSSRPVYENGVLIPDRTDDDLRNPGSVFTNNNEILFSIVLDPTNANMFANELVFETGVSSYSTTGSSGIGIFTNSNQLCLRLSINSIRYEYYHTYTTGNTYIYTIHYKNGSVVFKTNNQIMANYTVPTSLPFNEGISLFSRSTDTFHSNTKCKGCCIINNILTPDQVDVIESHLASKTGVSL